MNYHPLIAAITEPRAINVGRDARAVNQIPFERDSVIDGCVVEDQQGGKDHTTVGQGQLTQVASNIVKHPIKGNGVRRRWALPWQNELQAFDERDHIRWETTAYLASTSENLP